MYLVLPLLIYLLLSAFAIPAFMMLWAFLSDVGGFAQREDAPKAINMACGAVPIMWPGQMFGGSITSATPFPLVGALAGGALFVITFYIIMVWNELKHQ